MEDSYFDGGLLQLIGYRILGALITTVTLGIQPLMRRLNTSLRQKYLAASIRPISPRRFLLPRLLFQRQTGTSQWRRRLQDRLLRLLRPNRLASLFPSSRVSRRTRKTKTKTIGTKNPLTRVRQYQIRTTPICRRVLRHIGNSTSLRTHLRTPLNRWKNTLKKKTEEES